MHNVRRRIGRIFPHAAAIPIAIVFIVPLAWMLSTSLRAPGLPPPRAVEWLPGQPAWDNYAQIFRLLPLGQYALNSLMIAGLAVGITLVTASAAGFAMSQMADRARERITLVSIGLLLVPLTAVWLARYALFAGLGLINTYGALLAPAAMGSSPLFVLLFYRAFRRISREVFESARLDGAGAFAVWRRVALPLARPTVVAVGVLTFLMYWSDFINPLMYLKSQSLYTLPLGLRQLQQLDRTNWPLLMAASVVVVAPAVVVFLTAQRWFLGANWLSGTEGET